MEAQHCVDLVAFIPKLEEKKMVNRVLYASISPSSVMSVAESAIRNALGVVWAYSIYGDADVVFYLTAPDYAKFRDRRRDILLLPSISAVTSYSVR